MLEILDVPDGRPAERVDRLVRITHDTELRRGDTHLVRLIPRHSTHEGAHQDVLRVVGVLVLVHHDVPEPPPVVRGHLRVRAEQGDGLTDQVVEIERVSRLQSRLVLGIDRRDGLACAVRILERPVHGLGRITQLVLVARDDRRQHPRRELLDLELLLLGDHPQQAARIIRVVDREVGVARTKQRRLGAQDPHTDRVERRHPHAFRMRTDQRGDPLPHLGCGLVGERDREDLAGVRTALREEIRDAPGEHTGLARSGTGHDQQRAAAVGHRGGLRRIEAGQEGRGVRGGSRCGVGHRGSNLPTGSDTRPARRIRPGSAGDHR